MQKSHTVEDNQNKGKKIEKRGSQGAAREPEFLGSLESGGRNYGKAYPELQCVIMLAQR